MQSEHSLFPTDETLAAYIDGRLDEATRRDVAAHMADCAECRDVLVASSELEMTTAVVVRGVEMTPAVVVRGVNWSRNVSIGLAAAAAVAFALFLTPLRERIWPRDDLRELAAAAPRERLSDGRISGFPYRQRAKTYRGGEHDEAPDLDTWKFTSVAAKVRTPHAAGVADLVLNEQGKGVAKLEKALSEARSPGAPLLNDLAAAYIANGQFTEAANAAERAWKQSRTPEIAWNRAVAAEHVEPPAAAIAKWNEYLKLEKDPQWIDEAREKHIKGLQEALEPEPQTPPTTTSPLSPSR